MFRIQEYRLRTTVPMTMGSAGTRDGDGDSDANGIGLHAAVDANATAALLSENDGGDDNADDDGEDDDERGRRREVPQPAAAAAERQNQHAADDDDNDDAEASLSVTWIDNEFMNVTVLTADDLTEHYDLLCDLRPPHIILYEPDVETIRLVEIYVSTMMSTSCSRDSDGDGDPVAHAVRVYFLIYEGSSEQHRYAAALSREKSAFESLIESKSRLVMSVPDCPVDLRIAEAEDDAMTDSRSGSGSGVKRMRAVHFSEAFFLPPEHRAPRVVVDIREFRSSLPSLLYSAGIHVIPETLAVADYVISLIIIIMLIKLRLRLRLR